jgi:LuxR family maltose regulon positive regulatory protein
MIHLYGYLYGENVVNTHKTNTSPLTAQYMPRPRVDNIFNQATRCKLVYVTAGAGYGKTQAARHYIEQQPDAVVRWVQLTESDNVSSNYWEHHAHNISFDNPDLAARLLEFGFPDTLARFKQFVEILKIAEHKSRKRFLVFDDFHSIHSKPVLTFVERCAYLQFPNSCVMLISRKEPELNTVPLFAKGKASVITEEELRFTDDEISEFLTFRGIPFLPKNIHKYSDATKGWALAIQMLSLVLKRMPGDHDLALEAMKQNVFKLFETETWSDFPENIKKILTRSALVSDLPLAPLHMVSDDISFILNSPQLASFIWFDSLIGDYRIHPMYLEFLQSKVHFLTDDEKHDTYRQAAQWCSENKFYMDALRYFAKSRQYERILETLLSYPFKLPHDTCEYFLSIIEGIELNDENQNNKSVLFLKNIFIPILLMGTGRYEEARELSFKVIREWENLDTPYAINILYASYSNLAYVDMYTCTVTHKYDSPEHLKKSVEYYKKSSIPPAKIEGAFADADMRSFACLVGEGAQLQEFDKFLEAARRTAVYVEETFHDMYYGYEDLVACEIDFYKNQIDSAKKYAHQAIFKAREKNQYSIEAMAEHYLLRIALLEGDYLLAKKTLKDYRNHLDNPHFWGRRLMYDLVLGIFYAQTGLPQRSPVWLIMDDKETKDEIHMPAAELYVSTIICVALKKYDQALAVLCKSSPRKPQERFLFGELYLSVLSAVARIKTGDVPGAMKDFEKAYMLSFDGVFEMPFVERGKDLRPLVAAASNQAECGIPKEWLRKINRKASVYAKKTAVIRDSYKAEKKIKETVQLSNREREALVDLYHGLTQEEIAENRHLAVVTVKKLLQSVYTKLDANNGVDAIRIALQKKLIE